MLTNEINRTVEPTRKPKSESVVEFRPVITKFEKPIGARADGVGAAITIGVGVAGKW